MLESYFPSESLLPGDIIRMNFVSYAKILDNQGRLALWLSPKREKDGEYMLHPIGGGIKATEGDHEILTHQYNAQLYRNGDLRFYLPINNSLSSLEEIISYYTSDAVKQQQYDGLLKELEEELTEERQILRVDDLASVWINHLGFGYLTSMKKNESFFTLKIMEIAQVIPSAKTLQKLMYIAEQPTSPIKFVTKEEIQTRYAPRLNYLIQSNKLIDFLLMNEVLHDRKFSPNMKISKSAQHLLHPQQHIDNIDLGLHKLQLW